MIKKLFLDLNNFKANLGSVERGDSIELNIKLLDGEDYSRSKFRVLGAKADGKYVEQIEGINLEEKDLKIVLEDQFVNCEGIVKLELNVVSSETEITTKEFYFFVSNTMNAEIIDSADSIPTLEKVSKYVDDAVNNLDALKEASEDITIINSEFKEAEIKRKANELLRERSEKERVRLESIRTTEEADRIKAEAERKEAENNRKVAESNRKLAENTRKTNEAARVEAELNRQSLFEENEEIRNENENLRIASEKERIKFNSEAKTDELNRKEAEKNRVLAEEERKSSEESRVAAEAIRQNTYTDFNESEEERKSNEIKRQEAEALRVEAETRRDNLFSEKEEERNTSFIESEKVRNAAFNKAQDSRNTTFEESETIREEAFKISEKARNDAEELRVTAESERVKAEKLRVDSEKARVLAEEERNTTFTQKEEERNNTFTQNETNRNTTFTQSEEERKTTFEEAENARKVAESKRVKAESSRVEAEKLRVAAETERVEAENLRVTAEEERVAAETKRDEKIKELENKIDNGGNNSKNEEVIQARTATTGEVFNTLDERIDNEVDRLNKKIDVTMIQQEDKEIHTIDNSVEGLTTDIIVKGKIMYKKADGTYTDTWEEGCILESFGGEEGKISILSHGKNLWNKELFVPRLLDANSWDSSGAYRNNNQMIYLEKGKYTITCPDILVPPRLYPVLGIKDESGASLGDILPGGVYNNNDSDSPKLVPKRSTNMTITTDGYYYFNGIFLGGWTQENLNKYKSILESDFQFERSSLPTQYESYKEDKKDILLQSLGFDEGLRGINDISDELNSLRNVAIKRIGKREYREGDLLLDNVITDKVNTYYVLEEPIETPLDENINVKTFGERTYVSFENSISGTSSFKAPVNAAATISRLNRENRALEEENRSLRQDFESTTLSLTDSDLELVKQNVDMDFRLMEVEFALDIPQAILSSNIKFKNKKGEVKSMARTPYEMMKIVILSGDYDREDYMHKVGKYYERGRMTKEEHDELMSLMTADEVISK
ncbi:hypothetical protein KCL45_000291 [Clostridium perfringens]|nr:hypothetical protein [Clostridium perfringens]